MGIPSFYRWVRDRGYRGVLRRNVPPYVSSFSLDANGIIHQCAQLVYAYGDQGDARQKAARQKLVQQADPKMLEAEFYNALSSKLQEIITQVDPQEILVIAVDGVAPQAKISQQRQRRFKSAFESTGNTVFDSNCITPGTDFMLRLDNFIQRWMVAYRATLPPTVIYSSHMVPGEGEHKIMDLMRSGEITGEGAHVLYGMDADLIMLSLLAPLDHISLMREDINDVIDIDSLKESLQEELVLPTAIDDFVVMVFAIGNDFLPHMPALENLDTGLEVLMKVYRETGVSLVTDDDLDWDGLLKFLTNLSKLEPELLEEEARRDVKHPSRMLTLASKRLEKKKEGTVILGTNITYETKLDYNIFRSAWYQNELMPKNQQMLNLFRMITPDNYGVNINSVVDMCSTYLYGMAWIYNYYTKGTKAINSEYVYRYHHTPLLSDVVGVLAQCKRITGYKAEMNQLVLNPIHQLLAVLPLKSKALLPREVQHLMTKDSPISDMYPETAIIELDGKNADWQGLVLIPFVQPMRIIEAVNTTTMFSVERAQVYAQSVNIVMRRDPIAIEIDKKRKELQKFLDREKQKKRYNRDQGNRDQGDNRGRGRGRDNRGRGRGRDNQDNRGRGRGRDNQDNRGRGRGRGRGRDNRDQGRGRGGYVRNVDRNVDRNIDRNVDTNPPTTNFPTGMPPPANFPTGMPPPTATNFTPIARAPAYPTNYPTQFNNPYSPQPTNDQNKPKPWENKTTIL